MKSRIFSLNTSLPGYKPVSAFLGLGLCAILSSPVQASSDLLLEYQSLGGLLSVEPSYTNGSVLGNPLEMGPGLRLSGSTSFNASGWDVQNSNFEDALAAGDYWNFGFESEQNINLSSMSIRLDRSASGPDDFEIRAYWGEGKELSIFGHDFNDEVLGQDFLNIDLSDIELLAGENLTMVLAAFNSERSSGTFDMEVLSYAENGAGLQLFGEVAPVPLPAAAWAFLSGILGLGAISRRS